jgi:hypothetical protein
MVGKAPDNLAGEQPVPFEVVREQSLAVRDRLGLAGAAETGALPGVLVALTMKVEMILERIHGPEQPVLVLAEEEREGLGGFVVPGQQKRVRAPVDRRPEVIGEALAHHALDAVRGDHEIGSLERREVAHLALELDLDPELPAARVEDLEQPLARQPAEPVTRRTDAGVPEVRLDVRPGREALLDLREALGVGLGEVRERLVREHDSPAEGVVGSVAFEDPDRGVLERLLREDREVEPRRSASQDLDAHAGDPLSLETPPSTTMDRPQEWIEKLSELHAQRRPCVLVVVTEVKGQRAARGGARMIVGPEAGGRPELFFDDRGGNLERLAIEHCGELLRKGRAVSESVAYPPRRRPGSCGAR